MAQEDWTPAYLAILVLALVLLPLFTVCAMGILVSTVHACEEHRMELPGAVYMVSLLGPGGIAVVGAVALIAIGALWPLRARRGTAAFAGVVFGTCAVFMLLVTATGHLPLVDIIPIIYR